MTSIDSKYTSQRCLATRGTEQRHCNPIARALRSPSSPARSHVVPSARLYRRHPRYRKSPLVPTAAWD